MKGGITSAVIYPRLVLRSRNRRSVLFRLFQPPAPVHRHFNVMFAALNAPSRPRMLVSILSALLREFALRRASARYWELSRWPVPPWTGRHHGGAFPSNAGKVNPSISCKDLPAIP